jgi:hypothetical protein
MRETSAPISKKAPGDRQLSFEEIGRFSSSFHREDLRMPHRPDPVKRGSQVRIGLQRLPSRTRGRRGERP